MMMKRVKGLHTVKAIVIPSSEQQPQWISKHTPGGAGEQRQVLCVHAAARTSAYIQ